MSTPIVDEKIDSRRGEDGKSYEATYNVIGTDDPVAAIEAVKAEIPEFFGSLIRQAPRYQEVGPEHYEVTVVFGEIQAQKTEQATGSVTRDFQVGTEQVHITSSRTTVASYAKPGFEAPDCKGLIGVQEDGSVAGVDVYAPVSTFGYTIRPENSAVTQAYEILAGDLTACVNLTTFLGRPPGTVLFLGTSGSERSATDSELRLEFAYRPNETDLTVGEIEEIEKDGWDYLWVLYKRAERSIGGGKKAIVQEPLAVYIEEVFRRADLNMLLI